MYLYTHASGLDAAIVYYSVNTPISMIIKESLYNFPLFRVFFAYINTIPVNRSNHEAAVESMNRAGDIMITKKRDLLIAPEGTRRRKYSDQNTINILPLKKGAFHVAKHAKVRIVPVIVVGAGRLMPVNTVLIKSGTLYVKYCKPINKDIVQKLEIDELLRHTAKIFNEQYFNQPDEKVLATKVDNRLGVILFSGFLVLECWLSYWGFIYLKNCIWYGYS